MPLHEPPIQRCGSSHWLSDPCPKGECALLVFEKDRITAVVPEPKIVMSVRHDPERHGELLVEEEPEVTPDGPVKRLTAAEKQKLWRQRNAEKVKERDRLRKAALRGRLK